MPGGGIVPGSIGGNDGTFELFDGGSEGIGHVGWVELVGWRPNKGSTNIPGCVALGGVGITVCIAGKTVFPLAKGFAKVAVNLGSTTF